ncbi:hypothetical protein cypCar_00026772 [Cyprinus carpio]|nr:hypothetical protein cypCar_00026772 [Cyprinus carpio]
MGQQLSGQAVTRLPEKLIKHVGLMRDSGYLTYDEFLGRMAELNDVTAKLASGQKKHLLFEVQPGSDATVLWKVAVRIVCTKINKEDGMVEASRIMNLYQFIQLYKDITSQAAEVLSSEAAAEGSSGPLSSEDTCQASMWMGRSGQSRNCPVCRIQVTAANESWVMSDVPTEEDMAGYILNLADEAGHPHRP